MPKKRISVEIDDNIMNMVEERCKRLGVPVDYFVNDALTLVIIGRTSTDFGFDDD